MPKGDTSDQSSTGAGGVVKDAFRRMNADPRTAHVAGMLQNAWDGHEFDETAVTHALSDISKTAQ